MTAAKAVKTSVTSTNSLSQDYTNLDNQLPQTCHVEFVVEYDKSERALSISELKTATAKDKM